MDSFEKEHYTKLLKEIQLLSRHKAEKEDQRTLRPIPLITLENSQETSHREEEAKNCPKKYMRDVSISNILVHLDKSFDRLDVSTNNKKLSQRFKYKWISIEKHGEYDMFYLQSIVENFKKYGISTQQVESFIHSYSFYVQMSLLDQENKLPKYGNVYLLINEENKTCKVGMSWNIEQRYSQKKLNKELVYVVPVNNMKIVESKLINHFRSIFGRPVQGNEMFSYENKKDVKNEFKSIVASKEIHIDIHKTIPHHLMKFMNMENRRGYWISFDVMRVLFNYFVEDEHDRKDITEFLSLIKYAIERDSYVYSTYNHSLKTNVEYILFHKYRMLKNQNDNYINGSALYNSIRKADHTKLKYGSFKRYMNSDRFQYRIQQLKEVRPKDEPWYWHENKDQKYLEGYYIHYALVHFILDDLNARYAIHTSILMFNIFTNKTLQNIPLNNQISNALAYLTSEANDEGLNHILSSYIDMSNEETQPWKLSGGNIKPLKVNIIRVFITVLLLTTIVIIILIGITCASKHISHQMMITNP